MTPTQEPTMPDQTPASPLSEERVREYEQMLAAVTPGPWTPGGVFFRDGGAAIQNIWGPRRPEAQSGHLVAQQALMADAAFIAASPTIVAELLADRTALSARLEAVERDAKRLDWLFEGMNDHAIMRKVNRVGLMYVMRQTKSDGPDDLRAAIDAAAAFPRS